MGSDPVADWRDEHVLVLMPTARDAERTRAALAADGLSCTTCSDLKEICQEIDTGAGVALIAEELLIGGRHELLAIALREQPAWSNLPLVVLLRERADGRVPAYCETMNVSLVERPVRFRSLLSVIQAALRTRRHQYQVRDYLAERERYAAALRDQEERLQFALAAGRLGSWDLDLATMQMDCSALCKENFGRRAEESFSYDDLFRAIHDEDRERVRAAVVRAIEEHSGYDVEYRAVWPDGTTHWLMVRGRAKYDEEGKPIRMTGVSLDVTNRRHDEEELRHAAQKKDDFLALLAHELRNPLAPIRSGLEVTRLTVDEHVKQRAQEIMERQIGHMVRLIDDLLDVSRINRNKMELRRATVAVADAVNSAVETIRPGIEAAGHELVIDLPSEPILLHADLTRLAQVFANLLSNSAKYTKPGGRIELRVRREGNQVVVTVRDTGIGIPVDSLARIFDMFSQVDRSMERSTGGLGIGLALVKGLVEMHGGTVSAASAGPGRGSLFTVQLPALPTRVEPPREAPIARNGHATGQRILVVDDNVDSAHMMAQMLRYLGNEVSEAHDGIEAVEQAEAVQPDVILMDVGMPRLNGLDATRRIRAEQWGKIIKIIALTGWGQDSDRARSREAGCDGHLVKPVALDDLEKLLGAG
jgi:PAS domain S-box-containing protein